MGKGNWFQNQYTQNVRTRCTSLHCYTTPLNICPLAFISFINEKLLFQFSERAASIAVIPTKEKPFIRSLACFVAKHTEKLCVNLWGKSSENNRPEYGTVFSRKFICQPWKSHKKVTCITVEVLGCEKVAENNILKGSQLHISKIAILQEFAVAFEIVNCKIFNLTEN